MSTNLECQKTLRQFASRDFSAWQGLASECRRVDLESLFPSDNDWTGSGMLGTRSYDYFWSPVTGYENPVRVWLNGESVALLEVEAPEITNSRELLDELGEPDARLDAYRHTVRVPGGEWVYASRGLTLFVYPPDALIYHLAAYAGTSLEHYEQNLRPSLKVTKLPRSDKRR